MNIIKLFIVRIINKYGVNGFTVCPRCWKNVPVGKSCSCYDNVK